MGFTAHHQLNVDNCRFFGRSLLWPHFASMLFRSRSAFLYVSSICILLQCCCVIKRSSSLVVPGYWIYEVVLGSVTTAFTWGWINVTLASSHCIILLSSKPFILLIFILYKLSHISWPTLVSDFKMFLLPFLLIHQSSHTFIIRVIKWILYSLFLYLNWVPRRKSFSRTFWISWTIFFLKHWLFSGLPSRCSNTVLDHFRLKLLYDTIHMLVKLVMFLITISILDIILMSYLCPIVQSVGLNMIFPQIHFRVLDKKTCPVSWIKVLLVL